ncbi:MAG: M15 family peptidase [Acidobacteria bacterium]|nr:MAG: M15 family peptidase [Acidobacteriota bacterium]
MAKVDINQAHPVFKLRLERILADLTSLGWKPRIASLKRSTAEQAEKVKQGYSKTMRSWHVESTVGMLPVGRDRFNQVFGSAADIIDKRYGWAGLAANKDFKFWKDLGRVAKKHGCSWGGDWKIKDVAHVEMHYIEMPTQSTAIA